MSDWGRLHRGFHRHPKVKQVSNGAIGLWAKANSRSRDERTAGFVSQANATALGSPSEICELIEAELWDKVDNGFRFHDYEDWNQGGERPKTFAARLVHDLIPGHPTAVKQKMTDEVLKLLEDDVEVPVITAGIKRWLAKDSAPVSWLPHLVSDALRTGSDAGIEEVLRRCWLTGNVQPLLAHGYAYAPPDPPPGATVEEVRSFTQAHKREWIEQIQKDLKK